jgi:hypothetical protein
MPVSVLQVTFVYGTPREGHLASYLIRSCRAQIMSNGKCTIEKTTIAE